MKYCPYISFFMCIIFQSSTLRLKNYNCSEFVLLLHVFLQMEAVVFSRLRQIYNDHRGEILWKYISLNGVHLLCFCWKLVNPLFYFYDLLRKTNYESQTDYSYTCDVDMQKAWSSMNIKYISANWTICLELTIYLAHLFIDYI